MKEEKKIHKKRSLKRRIRKMMNFTNFLSVLFTCLLMVMIVSFVVQFLGSSFLNYSAFQLSEVIKDKMISGSQDELISYLNKINPRDRSLIYIDDEPSIKVEENKSIAINFFGMDMTRINGIEFRVWQNNRIIFDSVSRKEYENLEKLDGTQFLIHILSHEIIRDIVDEHGKVIGNVGVRPNPIIIIFLYFVIMVLGIFLLITNGIILKIITHLMSNIVTKPLVKLNTELLKLADGDIETAFDHNLEMKKPVIEVKNLMDSTNLIMSKMHEYLGLLASQNEELESQTDELASHRDELEAQNATLEERGESLKAMNSAYINRTIKLQNLLNNVGQGFLTIGSDLRINPEHSYECERMLSTGDEISISGMKITETLFQNQQDNYVEELFVKIFESPAQQKELFLSLLPEEITLNSRILDIQYKLVSDDQQNTLMLIILTDITQTRTLEKQMDEERNTLQMILKVLLNREEFIDLVKEYKSFTNQNFQNLINTQYEEMLREIHTYKGIFSQYYLDHTTSYLNTLENALYDDDGNKNTIQFLNRENLMESLEKDMNIITSYVGQAFLSKEDVYSIKEEKVDEIENTIKSLLPTSEYNKVLPVLKSIRYRSIKEMLKTYPDYTIKLSERLNKPVRSFIIEGDDVYVDPKIYQHFAKTLVHLFRNCVDHGVETEDERMEASKPLIATIKCEIKNQHDGFEICISDDGQGINPSQLLEHAIMNDFLSPDDISTLSQEDILRLIFLDGITTKKAITAISGRGVGLAAVKNAVDQLTGDIDIQSTIGKGTTFKIRLPHLRDNAVNTLSPSHLMDCISKTVTSFYKTLQMDFSGVTQTTTDFIILKKSNVLIGIKGAIEALLIISMDEDLGKNVVEAFMIEQVNPKDIDIYVNDVLAEISNTILGNVIGKIEEENIFLSIGVPAILSCKESFIKYSNSEIKNIVFEDSFSISMLLLDSNNQEKS